MNAFVVALRRMAAEEQGRADAWRRVSYAWWGPSGLAHALTWAEEAEARAEIYTAWADALSDPLGPFHPDWVRYGASRESVAGP